MSSLGEQEQRNLADSGSSQDGRPEGQGSEEASGPESLWTVLNKERLAGVKSRMWENR